jgi:ribokinase
MRLAVIGHVEWVTFTRAPFVPRAGEIVHLSDPVDQPGAGGTVSAAALRRFGADVTFFTSLGDDEHADRALDVLRNTLGLTVHAARRRRAQTRVLAAVDADHERTLFVIGENDHPTADDPLPWDELAQMDGVFFTGQDPRTLRLARAAPVVVVTARRFESLVKSGIRVDALVGSGRDRGEQFDLTRLRVQPDHVVVTNGSDGGTGYRAVQPPGPVVDTYGAGDTFVAGVTYGLAAGWELGPALEFAAERAAEALTWRGVYPADPTDRDGRSC